MICEKCLKELENSYKFRLRANRSEIAYFEYHRLENKENTSDAAGSIDDGNSGECEKKNQGKGYNEKENEVHVNYSKDTGNEDKEPPLKKKKSVKLAKPEVKTKTRTLVYARKRSDNRL